MKTPKMIVVILGPPGAGKGTQSELLAKRAGLPHVATGDLLRDAVSRGTSLGLLAKPYLERGELIPDETMVEIIRERLSKPDALRGAILDGYPRTIEQARALNRVLSEQGRTVDRVIYLRIPVEEVVRRIAQRYVCPNCKAVYDLQTRPPQVPGRCDRCGHALTQRPDDRADVVIHRLEVYDTETAPLIDFYRRQNLMTEVDGSKGVEEVHETILRALSSTLKRSELHWLYT
jgi:adenylate kinase